MRFGKVGKVWERCGDDLVFWVAKVGVKLHNKESFKCWKDAFWSM